MEDIKKKHHYVWKKYLLNWSKNDKYMVYAYLHKKKDIIFSSPENIAQQRFFYELDEFTIDEEIKLYKFIKSFEDEIDQTLYIDLFKEYTIYSNLKRQFDNKYINIYSPVESKEFQYHLKILKANTLENLHSKFEMLGIDLINIKSQDDLYSIIDENKLYKALLFICLQYTRTKYMKEKLIVNFKNEKLINSKAFNILPFIVSISLTRILLIEKELRYIFIKNQTGEKFVTTDQPVINLAKDEKNENGDVSDFRLFYPVSPEIALIIHYNKQYDMVLTINADINYVEELNSYTIKNSTEFVVFESRIQFEKYKNIILQ